MYQINFDLPIHVYFVGIGGVSMSGLAQILINKGFTVSGSDMKASPLTKTLEAQGVSVFYGHRESNISNEIDLIVYTAAINPENPELIKAGNLNIPMITRAQLLGQIMKNYQTPITISGTHGKTTTSSMISQLLLDYDTDPTLTIGGILKSINTNIRIGNSGYFVAEACEYTNSFHSFFPKIAIILNIEEDHLDFFKDLEDIRNSFRKYATLIPADGTLIINGDIDNVEEITDGLECNVVTFGTLDKCDYRISNIIPNASGTTFDFILPDKTIHSVTLNVPGNHNIQNATACATLAEILNIPYEVYGKSLLNFTGAGRRFDYKGTIGGVKIIDDYAHHPAEINATLSAARQCEYNTLWCVFQPHTYTRTKALFDDFVESLSLADKVVLADIYAARETDTLGISSRDLQKALLERNIPCYYFPTFDEIENFLLENCIHGDLLITMGAGDIVKVGENLLGQ